MAQATWNREELYEKVWNNPVIKVAEESGVSDVAIAKVCRKLGQRRVPEKQPPIYGYCLLILSLQSSLLLS